MCSPFDRKYLHLRPYFKFYLIMFDGWCTKIKFTLYHDLFCDTGFLSPSWPVQHHTQTYGMTVKAWTINVNWPFRAPLTRFPIKRWGSIWRHGLLYLWSQSHWFRPHCQLSDFTVVPWRGPHFLLWVPDPAFSEIYVAKASVKHKVVFLASWTASLQGCEKLLKTGLFAPVNRVTKGD